MSGDKKKYKIKKYYHWGEDRPPISYRVGTSDEAIINSILINQQEYLFPREETVSPELIYDIGANIGVVSVILANIYPEAKIVSFEPELENFALLEMNTREYPNILIKGYGLGAETGIKNLFPSDNPMNLGGFSNFIEGFDKDGKLVEPTKLPVRSIRETVEEHGVPDLIKIDVEGAECEILRNFPNLSLVSWITGELHSIDAEFLMLHTLSTHFRLQLSRSFFDKTWNFHALNKKLMDLSPAKDGANKIGLDGSNKTCQTESSGHHSGE